MHLEQSLCLGPSPKQEVVQADSPQVCSGAALGWGGHFCCHTGPVILAGRQRFAMGVGE